MKVVIQRVTESNVVIEGKINGKTDKGFLILLRYRNRRYRCRYRVFNK